MIKRTFIKDVYETKFKEDPENNFFSQIKIQKITHVLGLKVWKLESTETLHPEYKDASDRAEAKKKNIGFNIKKEN